MSQDVAGLERFAREFPAGTVLFCEGEAGRVMYVIRKGTVRLSLRVRDTQLTLSTLVPGEFFGEMALLNNQPRSATATVVEAATLLEIDSNVFQTMLRANTEIAVRMIQRLADRLGTANRHIQTLLMKDHVSRLGSYLLGELQRLGLSYGKLSIEWAELVAHTGIADAEAKEAMGTLSRLGLVLANAQGGFSLPDAMALGRFLEYPARDRLETQ